MSIKPFQIRAGRALLGWSADELAKRSGLSSASIQRAEKVEDGVKTDSLVAIVTALRQHGVVLTKFEGLLGVSLDTSKVGGGR